ncbi:hypothetical protein [Levilactobacillus brevis]|uniref:hypothetical protein n=1 Tax=Levilactobacillus brevis TaxID=1580 RepID=UPI000847EE09|nr:hypothetical protein [Levilactobacillus brevis]ODP94826.1 hypothetical protein BGC39_10815 [Levilactobacillus brevis]
MSDEEMAYKAGYELGYENQTNSGLMDDWEVDTHLEDILDVPQSELHDYEDYDEVRDSFLKGLDSGFEFG